MTEEILKDLFKDENVNGFILSDERYKELKDYITNLQQQIEEYSMIFDTFSKRPYAHKYLEEKKKELNNNKIIGLDSEMIYKDYYDYKSRCKKAIELINKRKEEQDNGIGWVEMRTEEYFEECDEVINILNGSDKNE